MCYVAILAYKEHICKLNDGNKVFKVSDRQYTWFIIFILVDKSVDVNNHCFLNNNVNSYSIKAQLDSLDLY